MRLGVRVDTVGVGPSHPPIIEGQFGYSYDRPARHVREYLTALRPLLRGENVDYHGETLTAAGRVALPGAEPPSVLLAALGPVMLDIAGELGDGTVTMWTGPETIGDYLAPRIVQAASRAGRPAPRVVVCVRVSVTADPDGARDQLATMLGAAGQLPSYRKILERQGKPGIHETLVAGDENIVARAVRSYADAGATELVVSPHGDRETQARTLDVLAALHSAGPTRDSIPQG
jgi:F420-dependent oxidoreductase-like protein